MASTDEILSRIDSVLKENRFLQISFVLLSVTLFFCGITAIMYAICTNQLVWTIPSAFVSIFLKWPIQNIIRLREKNIALATVPMLMTTLPREKAAEEIQKLIEQLYESKK